MACGWETSFVTLEAVGFRIGDGEFVVVLGPSGSGTHRPHSSLGGRPPISRVSQVCGSHI